MHKNLHRCTISDSQELEKPKCLLRGEWMNKLLYTWLVDSTKNK